MSSNSFKNAVKLTGVVSVLEFGAVGDGVTDDTTSINAAITAGQGKCIYFPAGTYCYDGNGPLLNSGTVIQGDGVNSSVIKVMTAAPTHVFHASGRGSGIKSLGFIAGVTQTSGCWTKIAGIESFIEDFAMTGDFNGIYLSASVGTVRNGRMQFAAAGATRIFATGGDNSQVIDGVLMGAQDGPNIAAYGILVKNNVALTITNTSVIQMGIGLGIIATQSSENVLNLSASNCYFDNCTSPVKILASGNGSINRITFSNVWAASSQGAGENGVLIINSSSNEIGGFSFTNCQFCLNLGAGISINGAASSVISDVTIIGGFFSQNVYGIYLGKYINGIKIIGASIGKGGMFSGNSNTGLFIDTNVDNLLCCENIITSNTVKQINYNSTNGENVIRNNIGFRTQYTGQEAILTGNTSVSFNHFCDTTPLIDSIFLTPRQSLAGVGISSFWVSAVSATQITVTANTAASSNFLFNFNVRANNS
jgi:hypothetical protein